jgi:hypothetical protein
MAVERQDGRTAYINSEAIDMLLEDTATDDETKKKYPIVHLIFPGNLKITVKESLDNFEARWRGLVPVTISKA